MKWNLDKKVIAIDFDGTITDKTPYPNTGKIREECVDIIRKLSDNYILILWTCRKGKDLKEAKNICKNLQLKFSYINKSPYKNTSRKIGADFYIDDKSITGEIDWNKIYNYIINNIK